MLTEGRVFMKVGVLGTGNMGKALISGLLNSYGKKISIVAYDRYSAATENLPEDVAVLPPESWFSGTEAPDAVIVAVKPADIAAALEPLSKLISKPQTLWISIAAGVSIASLAKSLPLNSRICRVMPNMPALIGEGVSAYALNSDSLANDSKLVEDILKACGKVVQVSEKLMNAVTGLSGSGPAYVFLFIEALIEGGITVGLSYAVARECAVQTVLGAAKMMELTGDNPNILKSKVMSPAGTTSAGLLALEKNAFKHAVISAVTDATKRAEQLGA